MDKKQKLELIGAKRGPIENELYAAELDLKVAKKGHFPHITEEAEQRVTEAKDKLAVLAAEKASVG